MAKQRPIVVNMPKPKPKKGSKGRGRGKIKVDWKQEGMHAGLGALVGLGIKYIGGYVAKSNPQAAEFVRRAANVGAAYAGHGTGELAYQVADFGVNSVITTQGGMAPGAGAGEFA